MMHSTTSQPFELNAVAANTGRAEGEMHAYARAVAQVAAAAAWQAGAGVLAREAGSAYLGICAAVADKLLPPDLAAAYRAAVAQAIKGGYDIKGVALSTDVRRNADGRVSVTSYVDLRNCSLVPAGVPTEGAWKRDVVKLSGEGLLVSRSQVLDAPSPVVVVTPSVVQVNARGGGATTQTVVRDENGDIDRIVTREADDIPSPVN